ncbi:hypothetical protein [Nocardia sp. NPDC005745]|uniref:hypothetical protein n=1 Tax=Nocardia sp. NPDC005745 TaxID=3157061 RepID=UPI0033D2E5A3
MRSALHLGAVPGSLHIPGLYLDDSYVLDVIVRPAEVFSLEAVLTPEHSMYHAPEGEEQYCICVGCYGICGAQAGQ